MDFNALTVAWRNLRTELSENSFKQKPVDGVIICVLVQRVKEATMYDQDSKSSLLDLILIHYEIGTTNLYYIPPLGNSNDTVLDFDFHIVVNNKDYINGFEKLLTVVQ